MKAFILEILQENRQLKQEIDFLRESSEDPIYPIGYEFKKAEISIAEHTKQIKIIRRGCTVYNLREDFYIFDQLIERMNNIVYSVENMIDDLNELKESDHFFSGPYDDQIVISFNYDTNYKRTLDNGLISYRTVLRVIITKKICSYDDRGTYYDEETTERKTYIVYHTE